jgi:hypothetical protein
MLFPKPIIRPAPAPRYVMPTAPLPVPVPQKPVISPTRQSGPIVGGNLAKTTLYQPVSSGPIIGGNLAQPAKKVLFPTKSGSYALMGLGGRGLGGWGLGAWGLGSLGDLGDTDGGAPAVNNFRSYLVAHIASKAGAAVGAAAQATPSIGACINFCASIWQNGQNGSLAPAQQSAWNQWAAAASDPNSDYNIYWMFGSLISDAQSDLITAANAYESNMWIDPTASAASYTFMDTTVDGTTWYGGATVSSSLNNSQWGTIFTEAFTAMQKGVSYGTLPLTYLELVCRAMLAAPNDRRFPYFQAPGVTSATDPQGIAFRCALKQIGWSSVVSDWFDDTQQGWAGANAQLEAQDKIYGDVITALDYTSGEVILQQIQSQVADYFSARAAAVTAFQGYQAMVAQGGQVSAQDQATMAGLLQNFQATDQAAYTAFSPVGMWSAGAAGSLNGLGLAQLIIYGVIGITLLGIAAYVCATMTATSRSAAAQTAAIAKSVLSSVKVVQQSCQDVWNSSAQGPSDQAALQSCMGTANNLIAAIPPPPPGSTDPLGFKSMAIFGVVAIAGIVGLYFIKKKFSGGGAAPATA